MQIRGVRLPRSRYLERGAAERVRRLRQHYPRWGKDKLAVVLRREGWCVSVSRVGRILTSLRQRGVLSVPLLFRVKRRRGTAGRPGGRRKPSDYAAEQPGDLVQLDTMDLRPSPGVVLKQFTARDVIWRWDVIEVHRRATSTAAALFLQTLVRRLPFPLRALQVDGSSEFAAVFEQACRQRGVRLFVLPRARPSSTAASSAPSALIPRSFMKSPPARSRSPSSTRNSSTGSQLTIPSAPSGSRLSHAPRVPGSILISTKGTPVSLTYWTSNTALTCG